MTLSDSALRLLPDGDTAPRCAEFSRSIGVEPAGTGIAAEAVVVIETPRPWPKPVFGHPLLQGLSSMTQLHCGVARVLAAEPREGVLGHRVLIFEREEVGATATAFEVADQVDLAALMSDLTVQRPSEIDRFRSGEPAPELAVLVCTQGSHDVCCGSDGVRYANELEAAAPGLTVLRVSHTGGHRFAPTAMTMPDGRMWADLDVATTLSILDLTGDASRLADRCRGWWGAGTGPAQVAEIALLRELGWQLDMVPRSAAVTETAAGWHIELDVAREPWAVEVEPGRDIPTITCRAEGGLPAKPGREYRVVAVQPPA